MWGFARRHHLGGPALIVFSLLLWAMFLGTVGAPPGPSASVGAGGSEVVVRAR
jgi:hypothetical protein